MTYGAVKLIVAHNRSRRQRLEIDRVGHCLVPRHPADGDDRVECCQDVRRTIRVACRCVEVDLTVERAAAVDPLVGPDPSAPFPVEASKDLDLRFSIARNPAFTEV